MNNSQKLAFIVSRHQAVGKGAVPKQSEEEKQKKKQQIQKISKEINGNSDCISPTYDLTYYVTDNNTSIVRMQALK